VLAVLALMSPGHAYLRMPEMRLNLDQRKHLASVVDKVAIAYFAVIGYTSYTQGNWLVFVHALVAFAGIEWFALWVLSDRKDSEKKHVD
jgi:TRAP-type C4-dicarboxylate transport system permease small subunit